MKRPQRQPGAKPSQAQIEAEKIFKVPAVQITGEQLERQAFEENRERLKTLRLARDAAIAEKK